MKALHFGAGNIGRGFIGKTLSESGFDVIFSDINQSIIDAINLYKEYTVELIGNNYNKIVHVNKISAIHSTDLKIMQIISSVDLITTAVSPHVLNKISEIIAQGIILKSKKKCFKPMNIIACENKIEASSYLKKSVLKHLPIKYYDYVNEYIGFVDCTIDTIIPYTNLVKNNKLFLIAEDFKEWIVNVSQFKGKIPKIIDMKLSNNLRSFIDRKLFTLNTAHSIIAYLGLLKKYKTVHETILDHNIRNIVKHAMQESGSVLIKRYNFDAKKHISYINKIFCRFENPFLLDSLQRIARNPLNKLGKEERLIKPLLGAVKYKLPYFNLSKGIAAALHYQNKNDLESMQILSLIKQQGIEKTLVQICHLTINSQEINSIISEYTNILNIINNH